MFFLTLPFFFIDFFIPFVKAYTCLDNMTVNKTSFPLRIKDGGRNKVKLMMVIYSHNINVQVRTRIPRLVSNCFSKLPDNAHVRPVSLGMSVIVSQTTGPRDIPHRRGSESVTGPLE